LRKFKALIVVTIETVSGCDTSDVVDALLNEQKLN